MGKRQHGDPEAVVAACRCLGRRGRFRGLGRLRVGTIGRSDTQSRLTQAVENLLKELAVPEPLPILLPRAGREVRPLREQFPQRLPCRLPVAELPACGCDRGVRVVVGRQVELSGDVERLPVVRFPIGVVEVRESKPPGEVGIESHGPLGQGASALPVSGIGHQDAHEGDGASVHGIERDGALRGVAELRDLPRK